MGKDYVPLVKHLRHLVKVHMLVVPATPLNNQALKDA